MNEIIQAVQGNSNLIHGLEKFQYLQGQIVQQEELLRKLNAHLDNML